MITIQRASLNDPAQTTAIIELLNSYALHPMGGAKALPDNTRNHLIEALKQRKDCRVLLAYDAQQPVGLCICFEGFSTFACRPLLNIHDLYVADGYRNRAIGKQLLTAAAALARESNCCKLTLEVLSGNEPAKKSYADIGFKPYRLNETSGEALFWEKHLD